jgi:hypothetical protein
VLCGPPLLQVMGWRFAQTGGPDEQARSFLPRELEMHIAVSPRPPHVRGVLQRLIVVEYPPI